MTYSFSFGFFVTDGATGKPIGAVRLEKVVDKLMHAMLERETDLAFDSSVGAVLERSEVDVDITVVASDEFAATATARDFVIESIRAIGGTPIGLFVFDPRPVSRTPQEWHERKAELAGA